MKIGFYCWGDPVMGMGHVFRCLALAQVARSLHPGVDIVFELKDHAEGVAAVVAAGQSVRRWPDAELPVGPWDILVVDQLQVPPEQMAALRRRCACLVSIDDAGPGHWQADLAFSLLYACRAVRPDSSRTDSRSGFDYMLIDPAFALPRRPARIPAAQLLLTQGGSDTWNVLAPLVRGLAPWLARHPDLTLNVHTGPAFCHDRALEDALAGLASPWQRHRRVPSLAALFGAMDVAVSAAGVTLFELLAAGVPCVITTAEDKELETASRLAAQGLAVDLGRFGAHTIPAIMDALDALLNPAPRSVAVERARSVLDGQGAARIISAVFEKLNSPGMNWNGDD